MKKTVVGLLMFSVIVPVGAFGAIEPYFARANEYIAISLSRDIKRIIEGTSRSSRFIDWIQNTSRASGNLKYVVASGACQMGVRVTYVVPPPPYVGPGRMVLNWDRQMSCE